jgi:hypothetical protein
MGAVRLHADYLQAVAGDPTSPELVGNLRALYQAAEKGLLDLGMSPGEIDKQVQLLASADTRN